MSYNTRTWLNSTESHYTGSVVCFDGIVSNRGKPPEQYTFLELSDCHGKSRIHYDNNLDMAAFIQKLRLLQSEIDNFIEHLENNE
jgi:hypothetical protein